MPRQVPRPLLVGHVARIPLGLLLDLGLSAARRWVGMEMASTALEQGMRALSLEIGRVEIGAAQPILTKRRYELQ
jgi:hypothetical protein